jgi:valyl-tRNA synthetase
MRSAESLKLEDKWILSRLNRVIKTVNDGLANYDMGDAARSLYEFLWSEFADWYVELAKPRLRTDESAHVQYMLWHVLETSMRLLHPIMPFITEEIWQALPHEGESIVVARFPEADESLVDEEAEVQMSTVMEAVRLIRNLRAEVGVAPGKTVDVITVAERGTPAGDVLSANADGIRRLARAGSLEVTAQPPAAGRREYVVSHGPGFDVYLRVAGLVDVDRELQRLDSELASVEKELARSSAKLANEQFLSRAPADVVEKERRIKAELEERKAKLEERRRALGGVARDGRTI